MSDKRVESMQIDLDEIVSLRQQLAECQAQVRQAKREALFEVADWLSVEHGRTHEPIELRKMAEGQP
jgi:hypothetical protein